MNRIILHPALALLAITSIFFGTIYTLNKKNEKPFLPIKWEMIDEHLISKCNLIEITYSPQNRQFNFPDMERYSAQFTKTFNNTTFNKIKNTFITPNQKQTPTMIIKSPNNTTAACIIAWFQSKDDVGNIVFENNDGNISILKIKNFPTSNIDD